VWSGACITATWRVLQSAHTNDRSLCSPAGRAARRHCSGDSGRIVSGTPPRLHSRRSCAACAAVIGGCVCTPSQHAHSHGRCSWMSGAGAGRTAAVSCPCPLSFAATCRSWRSMCCRAVSLARTLPPTATCTVSHSFPDHSCWFGNGDPSTHSARTSVGGSWWIRSRVSPLVPPHRCTASWRHVCMPRGLQRAMSGAAAVLAGSIPCNNMPVRLRFWAATLPVAEVRLSPVRGASLVCAACALAAFAPPAGLGAVVAWAVVLLCRLVRRRGVPGPCCAFAPAPFPWPASVDVGVGCRVGRQLIILASVTGPGHRW